MDSESTQEAFHEPSDVSPPPWWLVALLALLLVLSVAFLSYFVVLATR